MRGLPGVGSVQLTPALKVRANSRIQVDVDQDATGSRKVGTEVSGPGELRTALGPEATVTHHGEEDPGSS